MKTWSLVSVLRHNYFFRRWPLTRQLTKFAVVGLTSFAIDLGVYYLLTRGLAWFATYYLVANVISFIIANFWGFVINKWWTFRAAGLDNIVMEYLKFVFIYLIG